MEHVSDLAKRGITVADDEQAMALAQAMRLYGLAGCGRVDDAAALIPEVLELILRTRTPAARSWLWHGVIDIGLGVADIESATQELLAVCEELGGPAAIAEGQRILGNTMVLAEEPPDIDGAIAANNNAITVADAARSTFTGYWARFGLAVALVFGNRDQAPTALRDIIDRANDARAVLTLMSSIEVEVAYLIGNSELAAAAVILGHVENFPPAFPATARIREDSAEALTGLDDLDALKARGAEMSRQEVVEFALACPPPLCTRTPSAATMISSGAAAARVTSTGCRAFNDPLGARSVRGRRRTRPDADLTPLAALRNLAVAR